jgi:hypothetical protein
MKKLNLVSILLVCLFVFSISANATGSRTEFRSYEISPVENLNLGKTIQKIWTISYDADELPVTVVKRKTVEGIEYVVHSNFFEVSYAATANGFGAKEVRSTWRSVPKKISKAVISQEELKRQQIITTSKVDDYLALGLIASFLPDLINDNYTHVLN